MGLGDLVQKAVYLGVGLATLAGEKAGEKLGELRVQVQKLADEMVERGEMSTEEARRFVDDMINKAQSPDATESPQPSPPAAPRQIEILDDETPQAASASDRNTAEPNPSEPITSERAASEKNDVDEMRRRVAELQAELKRLQNES